MTPKQAKDVLSVLEELSTPEGCQPYIDAIWSDENEKEAKKITYALEDPEENARMVEASKYCNIRKSYPAFIAQTMQQALQAKETYGARQFFDDPEVAVFAMACQKRGLVLGKIAPMANTIPLHTRLLSNDGQVSNPLENFVKANHERPKYAIENTGDGRLTIDVSQIAAIAERYREGGRGMGSGNSQS